MGWKKSAVKLPFLSSVSQILGSLKSGADSLSVVLDAGLVGLKAARVLFASTVDPFVVIFSDLLTQVENLIKNTFDAGIYSLVVDPRTSVSSRTDKINLTFPTSLDSNTLLTPDQIVEREKNQVKNGRDPILTYNAMRAKVAFKRTNWKYDGFGIPLMTPNQCLQSMISSLDDTNDPNRPVFSDTAQLAAIGFIVSAPDLNKFIALAQPLLDILDISPLFDLLSSFKIKAKKPTDIPKGGQLPDWSSQAKLSDLGFMRQQRDALLSALAQVEALALTRADKSIDRLFRVIEQKLQTLDNVVKEFSDLITKLSTTLDAEGIYIFKADSNDNGGSGGNNYLKAQLRTFESTALNLTKDTSGYTFGFLLLGAGPSLAAIRSLSDLLLAARALKIVGGANAKQKVTFSSIPKDGSKIGIGSGFVEINNIDPTTFRRDLQSAINGYEPFTDCLVLLSTTPKGEESQTTTEGVNVIPGILTSTKTGLGFVVEFQGKDGRQPQSLLDFSDPGIDTILELCFNEAPTSGSFTLSINGVLTTSIPFTATADDLADTLNNTVGIYNKATVTGSFASCFTITFSKLSVVTSPSSNSLVGPSGPVVITPTLLQAGKDPANSLFDKDGRPIVITVETIVEGRRNDLCED